MEKKKHKKPKQMEDKLKQKSEKEERKFIAGRG